MRRGSRWVRSACARDEPAPGPCAIEGRAGPRRAERAPRLRAAPPDRWPPPPSPRPALGVAAAIRPAAAGPVEAFGSTTGVVDRSVSAGSADVGATVRAASTPTGMTDAAARIAPTQSSARRTRCVGAPSPSSAAMVTFVASAVDRSSIWRVHGGSSRPERSRAGLAEAVCRVSPRAAGQGQPNERTENRHPAERVHERSVPVLHGDPAEHDSAWCNAPPHRSQLWMAGDLKRSPIQSFVLSSPSCGPVDRFGKSPESCSLLS
jgi:hypothetical protein